MTYKEKYTSWLAFLAEQKNKPCMDCGERYPVEVLDFDHLGDKHANVGMMFSYTRERVIAEIAKCDLVCSNCHRIRTAKRRQDGVHSQR